MVCYYKALFKRIRYRGADLNLVSKKLLSEVPVGIQKTLGYDNRFELIFELLNRGFICVVDIINSKEVAIITVIPKYKHRRKH